MAVRRHREQASQYLGMVKFDPTVPEPVDLSQMREGLRAQRGELRQQQEQEALQAAAQQGAEQQLQAGVGDRATAPEGFAARFQQAHEKQSRAIHEAQSHLDSVRTVANLSREHEADPQGFAQAWDAYQQGRVGEIAKQDPERAVALEMELNEVGLGQQLKVEEQAIARQSAERLAQAEQVGNELRETIGNYLLESGDEEGYGQGLEDLAAHYEGQVDSGLISPSEAVSALQRDREILGEEFVRGTFRNSLEAGDLGGARSVIKDLRDGMWFERNPKARQLANELEGQLSATADEVGPGASLRRLRRMENAARHGAQPSMQDVSALADSVNLGGTPEQREQAFELVNSMGLHSELNPEIEGMNYGRLAQMRQSLDEEWADVLSPSAFNNVRSMVEDRMDELVQHIDEGNLTALGGRQEWNAENYMQQQGITDPDQARQLMVQHNKEVREKAASVAGVHRAQIPVWSREAERGLTERFNDSMERGDLEGAMGVVTDYFAPADGQPWQKLSLAMRAGQRSGEFGVASLYAASGDITSGVQLQRLAAGGRQASPGDVGVEPSRIDSFLDSSSVRDRVAAMTMGNPDMFASARAVFSDAYVGAAAEAQTRGLSGRQARRYAEDQMEHLLQPFSDTVEFENGTRLPQQYLADHTHGARAVRAAVNEVFENPRRLGLNPGEFENVQYFAPVPLGEESIGFMDMRTNRAAIDRETGEPIALYPPEIIEAQGLEEPPASIPERIQDVTERITDGVRSYRTARKLNRAAAALETPSETAWLAERVAFAAEQTPVRERPGDRWNTLGLLPADIEDRVDAERVLGTYRRAEGGSPASMDPRTGVERPGPQPELWQEGPASYALVEYLGQLERQFEGQGAVGDLVPAAYYTSPEVVQALLDDFGPEWREHLPTDARKFMERAR